MEPRRADWSSLRKLELRIALPSKRPSTSRLLLVEITIRISRTKSNTQPAGHVDQGAHQCTLADRVYFATESTHGDVATVAVCNAADSTGGATLARAADLCLQTFHCLFTGTFSHAGLAAVGRSVRTSCRLIAVSFSIRLSLGETWW